jgi:cyanophycinase-like exopeptidase
MGPTPTFIQVRLTGKALAVLNRVPSSIAGTEPEKTIIARIKEVLASGAKVAGTEAVKRVMSEVLEAAASYAS